jgi:hypothetical protein
MCACLVRIHSTVCQHFSVTLLSTAYIRALLFQRFHLQLFLVHVCKPCIGDQPCIGGQPCSGARSMCVFNRQLTPATMPTLLAIGKGPVHLGISLAVPPHGVCSCKNRAFSSTSSLGANSTDADMDTRPLAKGKLDEDLARQSGWASNHSWGCWARSALSSDCYSQACVGVSD